MCMLFFVGIIPIMWVELILSVLLIGLGIVLIVGVNHVRNSLPLQIMQ